LPRNGLDHGIRADAPGANLQASGFAAGHLRPDLLQVGHETPFGFVVGVADTVSGVGAFPADVAYLGHIRTPQKG
jgi:hypothetical protein